MTTSDAASKCQYCGSLPHQGVCPTVKALEYHPDGRLKRVEFKTAADYPPLAAGPSVPTWPQTTWGPASSHGTQF